MPPLPKPTTSATVEAIYAAYVNNAEKWEGRTISISTLAEECPRALWYAFRWVSQPEPITGRQYRLFETGNLEEDRWIDNLRMIGCEVVDCGEDGRQIGVSACGGHVKGKLDSEILGLPEAPKTWHVGEMKSHNAKSFAALKKDGVQKSKPLHYCQLQTYMYLRGRDRGIYLAVCKDTDELYAERLHLDAEYVMRQLARAQHIIDAHDLPGRLSDNPEFFKCRFCRHLDVCHNNEQPRVNCRTCLFSTPEPDGTWSCSRWAKPLSHDEMQAACPAHLWLPGLIDGEQIDADEAAGTVTYRLRDGTLWTDGASNDNDNEAAEAA